MYKRTRRLSKNFEEYCAEEDSPYPDMSQEVWEGDVDGNATVLAALSSQSSDSSSSSNDSQLTTALAANPPEAEMTTAGSDKSHQSSYYTAGSTNASEKNISGKRSSFHRQDSPITPGGTTMGVVSGGGTDNQIPDFLQNAATVSELSLFHFLSD
jgi:hypothetical protein